MSRNVILAPYDLIQLDNVVLHYFMLSVKEINWLFTIAAKRWHFASEMSTRPVNILLRKTMTAPSFDRRKQPIASAYSNHNMQNQECCI